MTSRSAPRDLGDGGSDAIATDPSLEIHAPTRWIGWRLRLLVLAALLGSLTVFSLLRLLAGSAHLDAQWQSTARQQLVLLASPEPALQPQAGRILAAIETADGHRLALDALALQRSPRWQVDDARRSRQVVLQEQMAVAFAGGRVTLHFIDGSQATVGTPPRGLGGLGLLFWPLTALALLVGLMGAVVVLLRPRLGNALFLLMTLCQAGNLLYIAIESVPGLGLPAGVARSEMALRMAFDAITAAAALHAFTLHPHRLPAGPAIAVAGWGATVLVLALAQAGLLSSLWWWAQALPISLGVGALVVLTWSYRAEPSPFAVLMRRFGLIATATLGLVTVAFAVAAGLPGVTETVATIGAVVWYLFFSSLLLLVPFLSRSRRMLREFAMLAGISTVAASLDLLFVAVFSVSQFASLTLSVFLALGVYAGARQWILNQVVGSRALTTERTFEQLYATARAVQARPDRHGELLAQLLRQMFEPLEVLKTERGAAQARVVGGGSALLVPVRAGDDDGALPRAVMLRFARRGKRLFTPDDARLADHVVKQLRQAVAYDKAVERGRTEERLRIAQDLHDDIGARLLTLMYQAQSPEMEDYIRHTLKDLKTLTRGLAARDHRLSHAGAEWKTDLGQRLAIAQVHLDWAFDTDRDLSLTMAQWSALTRVLRELVSNTLAHAQASRIEVSFTLRQQHLRLTVTDDGIGRAPQGWSHGLGLGGVRKRVKLLGGEVTWRENAPRGIICEVDVASFGVPR
jgi:signal transduction histidine kinase